MPLPQAELKPLPQDNPNAGWFNRITSLIRGEAPGWMRLVGFNGTRISSDVPPVTTTGNAALYIKPGAAVIGILVESSAGAQLFQVDDAAAVTVAALLVVQNIAWQSGTAFAITFDHAATANRLVTFPDVAGTVAIVETGTWTPVLVTTGTTTYTTQTGRYQKIGNMVIVNAHLIVNTKDAGASVDTIDGLPFTAGTDPSPAYISYFANSATNYISMYGFFVASTKHVTFGALAVASATVTAATIFGNGTEIDFAGIYYV